MSVLGSFIRIADIEIIYLSKCDNPWQWNDGLSGSPQPSQGFIKSTPLLAGCSLMAGLPQSPSELPVLGIVLDNCCRSMAKLKCAWKKSRESGSMLLGGPSGLSSQTLEMPFRNSLFRFLPYDSCKLPLASFISLMDLHKEMVFLFLFLGISCALKGHTLLQFNHHPLTHTGLSEWTRPSVKFLTHKHAKTHWKICEDRSGYLERMCHNCSHSQ